MKAMYLNEFAEKIGLHKDTIKAWQAKGLVNDRRNPANNYRVFTEEEVEQVEKLSLGKVKI